MVPFFNMNVAAWLAGRDICQEDMPTHYTAVCAAFGPTCGRGYRIASSAAEVVQCWSGDHKAKTPREIYKALNKFVQSYSAIPISALGTSEGLRFTYAAGKSTVMPWPMSIDLFELCIQRIEDE